MTAPTTSLVLSKDIRLFVGTSATPANDSAYDIIENENDQTLTINVDAEKIETKSDGKKTVGGTVDYTIKATIQEVYEDTGLATMLGALNTEYPYQLRTDVSGTPKVWVEGNFTLTNVEYKAAVKGVREISITLESSGSITVNNTPRALVTA